jgi:hypothetical protein
VNEVGAAQWFSRVASEVVTGLIHLSAIMTSRASRLLGHCIGPSPVAEACSPVVKNVVVTGAAGNIAYSIFFPIGAGLMLGNTTRVNLILLDMLADSLNSVSI